MLMGGTFLIFDFLNDRGPPFDSQSMMGTFVIVLVALVFEVLNLSRASFSLGRDARAICTGAADAERHPQQTGRTRRGAGMAAVGVP